MVGYYEAGVAPFGFDLTKHIKFGEENVLALAADNTSSRGMTNFIAETRPGTTPGSNSGAAFQWNTKDFNPVMGGLTRNVRLYVKNEVYQTLPLVQQSEDKGIYVYPSNIDVANASATINVESKSGMKAAWTNGIPGSAVDHAGALPIISLLRCILWPAGDLIMNISRLCLPMPMIAIRHR